MANSSGSAPEHADQTEITSGQKNIHAIQQVSPPTPSHEDDSVPSNPSQKARDLTDLTLNFLSNASNETLCACAVGLCATTYFILGRVGLVLIGAVGGVVLHATWDGSMNDGLDGSRAQSDRRKQKEIGAEIIRRTLDWRETQSSRTDTKNNSQAKESTKPQELEYSGFRPATRSALSSLTDAVIRDYVKWWYSPIIPNEPAFPLSSRKTLLSFILSVSNHLTKKRPADTFLDFLTNSSSMVIVFLNELSAALMTTEATGLVPEAAVKRYLEDEPTSNLANVLNSEQQGLKLNLVSEDILHRFLDPAAYHFEPAKTFLREMLSKVVLEITIRSCSKPEWINGWIVYLLEDGEPEILNMIDSDVGKVSKVASELESSAIEMTTRWNPSKADLGHHRRASKAEQAMEEAMLEAKRLSEMIAQDEARKSDLQKPTGESEDSASTATTENGVATPTSSESDRFAVGDKSLGSSQVLGGSTDAIASMPPMQASRPFTDFDQLISLEPLEASTSPSPGDPSVAPVLTLHRASVSVLDDGASDDRAILRNKPTTEYLLQVEPASSRFPGWMIVRKYPDFETLHEVLRRISVISGVAGFTEKHSTLPSWRGQSKSFLRQNLERYLQNALQFEALAESEGMKRFLEKDAGLQKLTANKSAFGFKGPTSLENVSKGVLDVLGSAPKGIAGGGKAVLGGMQGVFGAVGVGGPRKPVPNPSRSRTIVSVEGSQGNKSQLAENGSRGIGLSSGLTEEGRPAQPQHPNRTDSSSATRQSSVIAPKISQSQESLHLPPPPSSMPEDYETSIPELEPRGAQQGIQTEPLSQNVESVIKPPTEDQRRETKSIESRDHPPLTEAETRVAVELFFAVVNELYTLSSAWNIRLAMLNAAKTFLLRPGNPNLEAIRLLIQDDVITANFTTDDGLAHHLKKLRENSLPTEEELKVWPPEPSAEEKEKLRQKARKLLVEKGMPQALTSVMGAVASGEALGRVFDCLQIPEVSRGLMFALLLQAIKAVTQ